MIDQYNRKIEYLRVSVSNNCNLSCRYCVSEEAEPGCDRYLSNEEIIRTAKLLIARGIKKIRLTGGEPLLNKGIVSLVKSLKAINGLEELTMTTNGVLLEKYAKDLKEAGLDRVNVSLDSLKKHKLSYMTNSDCLNKILDGINKSHQVGLTPIKINTVLIGGFNEDEIITFVNLTKVYDVDVRFIELMPIGEAVNWGDDKFVSSKKVLELNPQLIKMESIKNGPARYYKLPESRGHIGLITGVTCDFCDECNRLRLTYDGKLKPCLHSDIEVDILDCINDDEKLNEAISKAINLKPEKNLIGDDEFVPVSKKMVNIGG